MDVIFMLMLAKEVPETTATSNQSTLCGTVMQLVVRSCETVAGPDTWACKYQPHQWNECHETQSKHNHAPMIFVATSTQQDSHWFDKAVWCDTWCDKHVGCMVGWLVGLLVGWLNRSMYAGYLSRSHKGEASEVGNKQVISWCYLYDVSGRRHSWR